MRLTHVPLLAILLASAVGVCPAADPPVRFPTTPVAPPPVPPGPQVIGTLTPGEEYFVPADLEYTWTVEPKGAVQVVGKKTPFTVFGKRAGSAETEHTYTDPFLYHVKPVAKAGKVTLIGVPKGKPVEAADIVVQTLTLGPDPAPAPPGPSPDPEPDTKPVKLWGFVVVEETAAAVAARGALLADPTLAAFLKAKGYHWRIVDKDVSGPDGKPPADVLPALTAAAGKPYPQFFVVDDKGNLIGQQNLPDAAGVVAALKKYGGK